MTNNNVELEINLFEELSDADLMEVVGGHSGKSGNSIVNNVTGTLANSGNDSRPTSGAILLVGGFITDVGNYTSNNAGGFTENVLQGTNKTLVDAGNDSPI